jgi:hypothetical protein
MANSYGNPIRLDTFSAAIDVNKERGYQQIGLHLDSIELEVPTTTDTTCLVKDEQGQTIFYEQCVTTAQSIIKYFNGMFVSNIKVSASGANHMLSGKLVITERM